MDLETLKTKWQHYDSELGKCSILNEDTLKQLIEANPLQTYAGKRSATYPGILFSSVMFFVFGCLLLHVNNNPPMILCYIVVLSAIVWSIGANIYKASGSGTTAAMNSNKVSLMMRLENQYAHFFSPVLAASLFMLLFLGLTVKTF